MFFSSLEGKKIWGHVQLDFQVFMDIWKEEPPQCVIVSRAIWRKAGGDENVLAVKMLMRHLWPWETLHAKPQQKGIIFSPIDKNINFPWDVEVFANTSHIPHLSALSNWQFLSFILPVSILPHIYTRFLFWKLARSGNLGTNVDESQPVPDVFQGK